MGNRTPFCKKVYVNPYYFKFLISSQQIVLYSPTTLGKRYSLGFLFLPWWGVSKLGLPRPYFKDEVIVPETS